MRALISTQLFSETGERESRYVHNAFSAMFLSPVNRDISKQMYKFVGKAVCMMPQFSRSTGYRNSTDYNHSPFQHGHDNSLGLWEYLNEEPERLRMFNSGMPSLATIGKRDISAGAYQFDRELGYSTLKEEEVAIVDVGGGRDQPLEAIKASFLNLKGRMILQDVGDVMEDAKAAGLSPGIEAMAASFFEPQPVAGKISPCPLPVQSLFGSKLVIFLHLGALVCHFRRIFHD
ncbi:MAG: hypothetical protein Q9169_007152 [Polycauliona sp. 2 TL-2023]